jgi:hypothetical protein
MNVVSLEVAPTMYVSVSFWNSMAVAWMRGGRDRVLTTAVYKYLRSNYLRLFMSCS